MWGVIFWSGNFIFYFLILIFGKSFSDSHLLILSFIIISLPFSLSLLALLLPLHPHLFTHTTSRALSSPPSLNLRFCAQICLMLYIQLSVNHLTTAFACYSSKARFVSLCLAQLLHLPTPTLALLRQHPICLILHPFALPICITCGHYQLFSSPPRRNQLPKSTQLYFLYFLFLPLMSLHAPLDAFSSVLDICFDLDVDLDLDLDLTTLATLQPPELQPSSPQFQVTLFARWSKWWPRPLHRMPRPILKNRTNRNFHTEALNAQRADTEELKQFCAGWETLVAAPGDMAYLHRERLRQLAHYYGPGNFV